MDKPHDSESKEMEDNGHMERGEEEGSQELHPIFECISQHMLSQVPGTNETKLADFIADDIEFYATDDSSIAAINEEEQQSEDNMSPQEWRVSPKLHCLPELEPCSATVKSLISQCFSAKYIDPFSKAAAMISDLVKTTETLDKDLNDMLDSLPELSEFAGPLLRKVIGLLRKEPQLGLLQVIPPGCASEADKEQFTKDVTRLHEASVSSHALSVIVPHDFHAARAFGNFMREFIRFHRFLGGSMEASYACLHAVCSDMKCDDLFVQPLGHRAELGSSELLNEVKVILEYNRESIMSLGQGSVSPLKAAVYDLLRHLEKLLQEMCRVDELFGVPARQHALTMALENPLGRSFHLLDGFAKAAIRGLKRQGIDLSYYGRSTPRKRGDKPMEATPRGTSQRTRFKFDKAMPKAKSYATTYTAAGIGDLLDFLHPHLTELGLVSKTPAATGHDATADSPAMKLKGRGYEGFRNALMKRCVFPYYGLIPFRMLHNAQDPTGPMDKPYRTSFSYSSLASNVLATARTAASEEERQEKMRGLSEEVESYPVELPWGPEGQEHATQPEGKELEEVEKLSHWLRNLGPAWANGVCYLDAIFIAAGAQSSLHNRLMTGTKRKSTGGKAASKRQRVERKEGEEEGIPSDSGPTSDDATYVKVKTPLEFEVRVLGRYDGEAIPEPVSHTILVCMMPPSLRGSGAVDDKDPSITGFHYVVCKGIPDVITVSSFYGYCLDRFAFCGTHHESRPCVVFDQNFPSQWVSLMENFALNSPSQELLRNMVKFTLPQVAWSPGDLIMKFVVDRVRSIWGTEYMDDVKKKKKVRSSRHPRKLFDEFQEAMEAFAELKVPMSRSKSLTDYALPQAPFIPPSQQSEAALSSSQVSFLPERYAAVGQRVLSQQQQQLQQPQQESSGAPGEEMFLSTAAIHSYLSWLAEAKE